jgi:hypothetical protein
MRTAGHAPSVRHAPRQPAPQALHTADPVPPLGPTDAPAHVSFLLEEGIGAHNVGAFIDALRQTPQQVHTLRFQLLEDTPIAALVELLAVLDGLPHLTSLEIDVSQSASGRLSAVKRELFAQSPVCVSLSLKVRRYLVRGATWDPMQDGWWRVFFERVDWLDALSHDATGCQPKPDTQMGRMAWRAFRHRQYFLLKALKTVCPDVYLSFEGHFPSQREIHALSHIGMAVQMHLFMNQRAKLDAACRVLRDRRLRLTTFHLVIYADLDVVATRRLLTSIAKAPHLTDLSISSGPSFSIAWPEEEGFPLPTTRRLKRLRLNVHAFSNQLPFAVRCLGTWPSQAVHLVMPRTDQWTVLCHEEGVQALRQAQRVILLIHDEKSATAEVFHALRGPLDRWLAPGHQTQTVDITLDINGSLAGEWDDWVFRQRHHLPLKALSLELRVQWKLETSHTLRWRLEDAWRDEFNASGATAFTTQELKLVDDVWANMAANGWLSSSDALHLAQVSRQTYDKADAARRALQAAQLAELMTLGCLDDQELERYTSSRAQAAPDLALINELRGALEARQADRHQVDRVVRLRARSATPDAPATPVLQLRYKA